MKRRLRVGTGALRRLLDGKPIEVVHRGKSPPERGSSVEVVITEPTEVRALIVGSQRRPRTKRIWMVSAVLDRSAPPMLLSAESGGGVIHPLPESADADSPEAHGYTTTGSNTVEDAGEAIPTGDVASTTSSKLAAHRFAHEKVDALARRRFRSLASRTRDALMQAHSHGVDVDGQVKRIEAELAALHEAMRDAA